MSLRVLVVSILLPFASFANTAKNSVDGNANKPEKIESLAVENTAPAPAAVAPKKKVANFNFSPLGLLIGYLNVDVDFGVSDKVSVGPSVSYWSPKLNFGDSTELELTSYRIGGKVNYAPKGIFKDGVFFTGMISQIGASATATTKAGSKVRAEASAVQARALLNYGWFWDTFNMTLGAGLTTVFGGNVGEKIKVEENGTTYESETRLAGGTGGTIDFLMGLTF